MFSPFLLDDSHGHGKERKFKLKNSYPTFHTVCNALVSRDTGKAACAFMKRKSLQTASDDISVSNDFFVCVC